MLLICGHYNVLSALPLSNSFLLFKTRLRRVSNIVVSWSTIWENFLLWSWNSSCLCAVFAIIFSCILVNIYKYYLEATLSCLAFPSWSEMIYWILFNLNLPSIGPFFLEKNRNMRKFLFLFDSLINWGTYKMSDMVSLQKLFYFYKCLIFYVTLQIIG